MEAVNIETQAAQAEQNPDAVKAQIAEFDSKIREADLNAKDSGVDHTFTKINSAVSKLSETDRVRQMADVLTAGTQEPILDTTATGFSIESPALRAAMAITRSAGIELTATSGIMPNDPVPMSDPTPAVLTDELIVDPYFVIGKQYDFIRNRPPGQADRGFIFEQKLSLEVKTSTLVKSNQDTNYAIVLFDPKKPNDLYDLIESHNKIRGRQVSPMFKVKPNGGVKALGTYSEKKLFEEAMQRTLEHARNEKVPHFKLRYLKACRLTENMWLNMYPGEFLFPRAEMETIVPV